MRNREFEKPRCALPLLSVFPVTCRGNTHIRSPKYRYRQCGTSYAEILSTVDLPSSSPRAECRSRMEIWGGRCASLLDCTRHWCLYDGGISTGPTGHHHGRHDITLYFQRDTSALRQLVRNGFALTLLLYDINHRQAGALPRYARKCKQAAKGFPIHTSACGGSLWPRIHFKSVFLFKSWRSQTFVRAASIISASGERQMSPRRRSDSMICSAIPERQRLSSSALALALALSPPRFPRTQQLLWRTDNKTRQPKVTSRCRSYHEPFLDHKPKSLLLV